MKKLLLLTLSFLVGSFLHAQLALPLDFELSPATYTFTNFDGGNSSVITNPQTSGINTSSQVGEMVKGAGQPWGGSFIELDNPIDFSVNKLFKMKVYSPRVGARVLLKVEDPTNGAIFFEKEDTSTVANAWEELTFDYSPINTSNTYQKIVLIWDLGVVGDGSANFTFLYDDIVLTSSGGPVLNQVDLPITFDDAAVDYTMTDFGGNASALIADPNNSANMVAEVTKGTSAQLWAGTTMSTANGLASALPFSATDTKVSIRIWSPDANIPIRVKAEDKSDPTISVETETMTTVANQWETLEFDFSNEVMGTAALNLVNTYDLLSIFFNFGTDGATAGSKTYLFDDVNFGTPVMLSQIELPVTFEDSTVDYTLTDFGGNFSFIVPDPTLSTNTVAEVNKDSTAQLWAGTTISTPAGMANAIPFTASETFVTVRVWSPDAGIPIRLKAEDHTDGTISVETETMTTVANQWETLEFDFSNEVMGTAAINLANTYDMLSIFFNFGTDGATAGFKTYYFDDVMFGAFVAVDEAVVPGLKYYPNPATDRIAIEASQQIESVQVFDMMGREVIREHFASMQTQLDLTQLDNGVYLVKVTSGASASNFRMLKN